jgi:hypothetical protein
MAVTFAVIWLATELKSSVSSKGWPLIIYFTGQARRIRPDEDRTL